MKLPLSWSRLGPILSRSLLLVAVCVFFAGCAASPVNTRAAWEPNRHTGPVVTPFWVEFPPKAEALWRIPNATLPRNTEVRLLGKRRGFALVQLESLERGWVPRGTLRR